MPPANAVEEMLTETVNAAKVLFPSGSQNLIPGSHARQASSSAAPSFSTSRPWHLQTTASCN